MPRTTAGHRGERRSCRAAPGRRVTDTISQPMVSSSIAEAMITWPTVRRTNPRSRTTSATIFTEEIASAVPRNSAVMARLPGSAAWSPAAARRAQCRTGTADDAAQRDAHRGPARIAKHRQIGLHAGHEQQQQDAELRHASSIAFCSRLAGNSACHAAGASAPNTDGPSSTPTRSGRSPPAARRAASARPPGGRRSAA